MEKIISKLIVIYIVCYSIFQSSCSFKEKEATSNKHKLTSKEINEVLSLLSPASNSEFNLHVLYSEFFNDSTFIIEIWQHQHLPSNNELIEEVFNYNGSKVYIYDSIPLNKNDRDRANIDLSPFFIVDANYWSVLVTRRKEQNQYFKVEVFSNYSDSLKLKENLDMF